MCVRIQKHAFDAGAETAAFLKIASEAGAGGAVTFTGLVRDVTSGPIAQLEIEHYPGMTEAAVSEILAKATKRWSLTASTVIHRYGILHKGEAIMMVATAAPHRAAAFEAAEFLMDYLKSRAPFWKKEVSSEGSEWVEATTADDDARERWG